MNAASDNVQTARKMLAGASCWVLTDGKAGDEAPCLGLAQALGLDVETRVVRPRKFFALLAPRGPVDPAERPDAPGSPIAPPFPEVLIASGRRAVPYLRAVRRASGGKTFTIFLKDPRIDPHVADMVWVAEHDRLRGDNVMTTLTAPHVVTHETLNAARENPDPRIARLPEPRMALLLGGDSRHYSFHEKDIVSMVGVVESMVLSGAGAMITPSRRTPPQLLARLRGVCADAPMHTFLWDGTGENPYVQMLAHASLIVVTADSTNMVGEAIATDAPVMVYEPTGGSVRLSRLIRTLVADGRVRRWRGRLESWPCVAHDDTPAIADEAALRFALFRAARR
ncbi:MAG TPA: mitochondrial fission ELM1 family protein [Rhodoblastus sp.]|nr:mitochondrial fission ELM1 family protein [Rhodoblastus sp.]